jgi:hypothetical protein
MFIIKKGFKWDKKCDNNIIITFSILDNILSQLLFEEV